MLKRQLDTLMPVVIVTVISFFVAWGLFALLKSTATVNSSWFQLGGGAAGFLVIFWMLRSWSESRDARRAENLAIEIAQLSATNIVRESGNDINALNTAYSDMQYQLKDSFKRQENNWVNVLLKELHSQTIRQARNYYPELRQWEPEETTRETVDENFQYDRSES